MCSEGPDKLVMRKSLISGLLLVAAALLSVLVGSWLDLELDSVALLGLAAGAVIALVPDATVGRRLAGFALGVVVTVVGYYVRASLTPDTATGRAVFAALVVALAVGIVLISAGRLPLWASLLGAATFAGAFETTYAAAPPRVLDNSISSLTSLALCVAVGFVVAGVAGAARPEREEQAGTHTTTDDEKLEAAK